MTSTRLSAFGHIIDYRRREKIRHHVARTRLGPVIKINWDYVGYSQILLRVRQTSKPSMPGINASSNTISGVALQADFQRRFTIIGYQTALSSGLNQSIINSAPALSGVLSFGGVGCGGGGGWWGWDHQHHNGIKQCLSDISYISSIKVFQWCLLKNLRTSGVFLSANCLPPGSCFINFRWWVYAPPPTHAGPDDPCLILSLISRFQHLLGGKSYSPLGRFR